MRQLRAILYETCNLEYLLLPRRVRSRPGQVRQSLNDLIRYILECLDSHTTQRSAHLNKYALYPYTVLQLSGLHQDMLIIEFIDVAHGLSIEQIVLITHKDSAIPRGEATGPKGAPQ